MKNISTMDYNYPQITPLTYVDEYKKSTDIPLRKILAFNLDIMTTCIDLRSSFSAYGCVEECEINRNVWRIPLAHITFKKEEDAIRAMSANITLHNNRLRVRPASYYQQPENLEQLLLTSERLNKIQNSPKNGYNFHDQWNDINKPSINMLNDDCLGHIFSFLPITDKVRVEIVCKRWKCLSRECWSRMRTLDFSASRWGMSKQDIISISTVGLCGVLLRCGKYLREINLRRFFDVGIFGLTLPSYYIPKSVTTDMLPVIGEHCPNLKKFDTTALFISAEDIDALTRTCSNLTIVLLRTYRDDSDIDGSLEKFFQKMVQLEHFQINDSGFTGRCLLLMPKETLHTFIIDSCDIDDKYLSEALKRLIKLRNLQILNCHNLTGVTISVINTYCTNLRSLKLDYLVDISMMEFMNTKLVNLETLSIVHNHNLTDNILSNIVRRCSKLTQINVEDTRVTSRGVSVIQLQYRIPIKFRNLNG